MSYDTEDRGNIAEAIAAGVALAEPTVLVERHALAFALPEGAAVHEVDIEKYLERPTRKRGTYNMLDAKSFIAFVNREKGADTYILATRERPGFTAVFNGNNIGGPYALPGWGDYKATYSCPHSPEWNIWNAANGKRMNQLEFATFMEDNFTDVVQPAATFDPFYDNWPDGSTMLAVSKGLEAKKGADFKSYLRLDNGQVQFKYEEDIQGQVQGGLMEVPQKFAIGIPIFAGTAPWQIVAKLRYRVEAGGRLVMWFDFERLFKITERAFDEARAEIEAGTNVPIYLGSKA